MNENNYTYIGLVKSTEQKKHKTWRLPIFTHVTLENQKKSIFG